jgi:hypothetical protein
MDWFCLTKAFATGLAFIGGVAGAMFIMGGLIVKSIQGIQYLGDKTFSRWDIIEDVALKILAVIIVGVFGGGTVYAITMMGLDFLTCKI